MLGSANNGIRHGMSPLTYVERCWHQGWSSQWEGRGTSNAAPCSCARDVFWKKKGVQCSAARDGLEVNSNRGRGGATLYIVNRLGVRSAHDIHTRAAALNPGGVQRHDSKRCCRLPTLRQAQTLPACGCARLLPSHMAAQRARLHKPVAPNPTQQSQSQLDGLENLHVLHLSSTPLKSSEQSRPRLALRRAWRGPASSA